MKLMSWNVNGLRAVIRKDAFLPFLSKHKPDVLCLQEVKIDAGTKEKEKSSKSGGLDFPGYTEYWNSAERKGYSGTMTLVKESLTQPMHTTGVSLSKLDTDSHGVSFNDEGRVQTLEFAKFYLINAYIPMTRDDLSRLDFKVDFDKALHRHIKKLEKGTKTKKGKPVILNGDYNVAHEEIDIARPRQNDGKAGFHPRERAWMGEFLDSGFVDSFRLLHPKKIAYTFWSYRGNARANNVGWRLDYFCLSRSLGKNLGNAYVLDKVMGSDHAPIGIEIDL